MYVYTYIYIYIALFKGRCTAWNPMREIDVCTKSARHGLRGDE